MKRRISGVVIAGLCTLAVTLVWVPAANANVYAAHLSAPIAWNINTQGPMTLEYRLNEPASTVTIEVFRNSAPGTVVKTISGTTVYGLNTVMWDGSADGGGQAVTASDYAFRVIATHNTGHATWTNITPKNGLNEIGSAQYYAPQGLAVNRDQGSPDFGTIFVLSGENDLPSGNPGASAAGNGLFMLHNDMTFVGVDALDSFIEIASAAPDDTLSPWKGKINPNNSDEIAVSSFAEDYWDVWLVQPSTGTVNVLLDATTTGPGTGVSQNHGNTLAAITRGIGANRVLYTIDEDFDAGAARTSGHYDILGYEIGTTASNFVGAPNEVANGGGAVTGADGPLFSSWDLALGENDLYLASRRTGSNATDLAASRFSINGETGALNAAVWSRSNPELTAEAAVPITWTRTYAIAVDENHDRAAIGRDGGSGETVVLRASNGTLHSYVGPTGGSRLRALAWDAAGNLYTSNESDEHVRMWSPPDGPNSSTTTYYATMNVTGAGGGDTTPPAVLAAVSRRTHGGAGDFEVAFDAGGAGIECRTGGPSVLVITFDEDIQGVAGLDNSDVSLTSTGAPGTVNSVSITGDELTVGLTGASTASKLTIAFPGIADLAGNPATDTLCLSVLPGDANGDASVNIFDLIAVRNQLNQPVTTLNFRSDVNADSAINIFDLIAVRNVLNTTVGALNCP